MTLLPVAGDDSGLCVGVASASATTSFGKPVQSSGELASRLEAFCRALGHALGIEVTSYLARSYPGLLEALNAGRVDVAWLPPVVALRAASSGRALPIALPVREGISSFYTALFARKDSGLVRPSDLKGVRAAWVDSNSASGYLVIRAALRAQGVHLNKAFSDERLLGSHGKVVKAVLDGEADVGATYLHHMPGTPGTWRSGWGDAEVNVISRVGPIPGDVVAMGIHVPVALIRRVQAALVGGPYRAVRDAAQSLLEADGFVEVQTSHLEPLEQLLGFLEDTAGRWGSVPPPRG